MSTYHATVRWSRGDAEFVGQHYSRGHTWHFDEGVTVPASASPHVVKAPFAVAAAVDPEEALVAALSSCHMLFFLSFASRAGVVVDAYEDAADGLMERDAAGKTWITKITLRPVVTFRGTRPDAERFSQWHHEAHEQCYLANTVRSEVAVEPRMQGV